MWAWGAQGQRGHPQLLTVPIPLITRLSNLISVVLVVVWVHEFTQMRWMRSELQVIILCSFRPPFGPGAFARLPSLLSVGLFRRLWAGCLRSGGGHTDGLLQIVGSRPPDAPSSVAATRSDPRWGNVCPSASIPSLTCSA